jgi:hypothetical protein
MGWALTGEEILNYMLTTGMVYVGVSILVLLLVLAIVNYILGRPQVLWDYVEEVLTYVATVGSVLLAVGLINAVLVGNSEADPASVYGTMYNMAWNALRARSWWIFNTCSCPFTALFCGVRQVETENATTILESSVSMVPMAYLAKLAPQVVPLLIAVGLGLSTSRLRPIGSLLVATGLGIYAVVYSGGALISMQPFYREMTSDPGILWITQPSHYPGTVCISQLSNDYGNFLSSYNELASYVAQGNAEVYVLYALLVVAILAIRSALW